MDKKPVPEVVSSWTSNGTAYRLVQNGKTSDAFEYALHLENSTKTDAMGAQIWICTHTYYPYFERGNEDLDASVAALINQVWTLAKNTKK